MWCLPNIQTLNERAVAEGPKLKKLMQKINQRLRHQETCDLCEEKAKHADQYFDIFSETPKGLIKRCTKHMEDRGFEGDDVFECVTCNRWMVTNYTWENYFRIVDEGRQCLPCAAKEYIADKDNWIGLTDEDIAVVTWDVIRKAPHVLAHAMPVPDEIKFHDSVTMDSSSGGVVRGCSSADSTPHLGVAEIRGILERAKEEGYTRALLILDAAYQFAVSIGIYTDPEKGWKPKLQ
jgi:hypothetical protein